MEKLLKEILKEQQKQTKILKTIERRLEDRNITVDGEFMKTSNEKSYSNNIVCFYKFNNEKFVVSIGTAHSLSDFYMSSKMREFLISKFPDSKGQFYYLYQGYEFKVVN